MLLSFAVAVTVLASPAPVETANQPPKGAVFLVIARAETSAALPLHAPSAAPEAKEGSFLGGVLAQLAVVKPHRSEGGAPPGLQMVLLIAPMRDRIGFRAFGSF